MAKRGMHLLTALQVQKMKKPGRHADGNGLYLVIDNHLNRKWVLRVQHGGRRRDFGLGAVRNVSLAEAREGAQKIRKQLREGLDPVMEKKRLANRIPTFRDAAQAFHKEHLPSWKNAKHGDQWLSSLENHVFKKLGSLTVDKIDGAAVRSAILDIWLEIPPTGSRVLQRIGKVLDWAYANGHRETPSPTHSLLHSLPKQPKNDRHFAAMPYQDVPAFLQQLDAGPNVGSASRLLLEFIILTAVRSGEARNAEWDEISFDERLWRIPAERMKAGKEHVVPLGDRSIVILRHMQDVRRSNDQRLIFEGQKHDRPLSDMTLTQALRRMDLKVTVHGFRSSFRDWAAERADHAREVAEQALAHVVKNPVERAYRRSDLLEKRRTLMETWEQHCTGRSGNVIQMNVG